MHARFSVLPRSSPPPADEPDGERGLEGELSPILARRLRAGEAGVFERVERLVVRTAFELAGANQVRAARMLGVSRNTLRTHLARLGLIPGRRRVDGKNEPGPPAA